MIGKKAIFSNIFLTSIFHLLLGPQSYNLHHMYKILIWREWCLKMLILVLVFFLCKKTGNFFMFFKEKFSTFHKIKTITFIKNLRHRFLRIYIKNAVLKFSVSLLLACFCLLVMYLVV